jgi:GT2 family glycosyltransferase
MQLSIIIVNYNVKYFLEHCLLSVVKACQPIEAEIFVVDNMSTDGSAEMVSAKFPQVKLIANKDNIGFAKANNQAVDKAKGKYILYLNPDTIVPEDCFIKCLDFFQQYPDAGALGVRMLDGNGSFLPESKRSFPSPVISFYKLSGLTRLFPRSKTFGKYHLGYLDEHANHEVNVLAGAFMFMRKDVALQTEGFDEQFFMYGEDIDLSYRIQKTIHPSTGEPYRNYYLSETSILHFKGESTKKGSLNYVRMFYLAMSQFVEKHYSSSRAGMFHLLIRTAIWGRALVSLIKQFIQKTGVALMDGLLIWFLFWLSMEIWKELVKKDTIYDPLLVYPSFAGFSMLFIIISYYTGLYQKKFSFRDLWKSGLSMLIILLAVYSLLPESVRFSRGIVILGSLTSLTGLFFWRKILLSLDILEPSSNEKEQYTIIVGSMQDAGVIAELIVRNGQASPVKGIVSPTEEPHALGTIRDLLHIVQATPVRELIFCESARISFKDIIGYYQQIPKHIKLRIHAEGSQSIIGSDSKFYSGEAIGGPNYQVSMPVNRRLKRLLDVVTAIILILLLPLHFIFNPKPLGLLKHIWLVLINQRTWIGYGGTGGEDLPPLPKSILSPAGLPESKNQLPAEVQNKTNEWYAQQYEWSSDLIIIARHYKNLGVY